MALRIRFRGGEQAGRIHAFDDDVERIVIGRDPEQCHVVLPPGLTQVGREHLALKRVLARYRLVLNKGNPVYVDGERALDGQELPEVAYVRLGQEGPQLVVQTLGVATVPPTEHHDVLGPDLHEVVHAAARRSKRTRAAVFVTFGLLAVLVGVIVYLATSTGRQVAAVSKEQERVRGELGATSEELERMAAEHRETTSDLRGRLTHVDDQITAITPDLSGLRDAVAGLGPRMEGIEERMRSMGPRIKRWLNRAEASVYVVAVRDERGVEHALATAFVVEGDQLATNGHVAEFFERVSPGGDLETSTMLVRSPGENPRDHEVQAVRIHPGYAKFLELWSEYRPTGMSPDGRLHSLRPAGAACDVAVLEVADAENLAAPLPIAGDETLHALGAGDVVGFLGFPTEEMSLGGVNLAQPRPTTQIAHVTAVTNFFLAAAGPENRLLVQHSLPVTGGASGSPILDENGDVVAVLSAGNMELSPLGSRAPSAVLVNFAQRSDLVQELVDDRADDAQDPRTERWRLGISTLMSLRNAAEKGANGFIERYLDVVERDAGVPPKTLADWAGAIDTDGARRSRRVHHDEAYEIPKKGLYVFFAYGVLGQNVDVTVLHETDDTNVLGSANTPDWYAAVRVEVDEATKVRLRVYGTRDAEFRLFAYAFVP